MLARPWRERLGFARERGNVEAALSLGSNLGDRLEHLREAKRRIAQLSGVRLLAQSPVYETEPVGVKPKYRHLKFLNAVLVIDCAMTGPECLVCLRQVEDEMGRRRTPERFAPRTIDIDLIYAGDVRVESADLCLPHPRWHQRRFVVQPLADVRPDLVVVGQTKTVREILAELPLGEAVTLFTRDW